MKFSRYLLSLIIIQRLCHINCDSGDEGIRTLDPLLARQVLSQLSYAPKGYLIYILSQLINQVWQWA